MPGLFQAKACMSQLETDDLFWSSAVEGTIAFRGAGCLGSS